MELEIKHLAPYLPYGLKIKIRSHKPIMHAHFDGLIWGISISDVLKSTHNSKAILRPLSDLTKEIEVNGEKFVPIERLFELEYPANKGGKYHSYYYFKETNYTICSHYGSIYDMRVYTNSELIFKQKYWIAQKLFEWHFDVFGLIEAGLAIDINTLNN